ncbi:hypothetical protein F5Y06DRAFT_27849 [Hypoxylon sp. FL0890]|nr:hypothetical protein F5Y06DRAFT_27849 [Hypoxylon sp. FL0890]
MANNPDIPDGPPCLSDLRGEIPREGVRPQPFSFWAHERSGIIDQLDANKASLIFRAFGWHDNGVISEHWQDVDWTLDDFARFYDCPYEEKEWNEFVNDYLSRNPLERSPDWKEIVATMHVIFSSPGLIRNHVGVPPGSPTDKRYWDKYSHWTAYILRLIQYWHTIDDSDGTDLGDFEMGVRAYAQSFGEHNSFYSRWGNSDKWIAMYLLYLKLATKRDDYTIQYLIDNPDEDAIPEQDDLHPAVQDEARRRREEQIEWRSRAFVEYRNNMISRNYLRVPLPWYQQLLTWFRPWRNQQ